jgi:preprotein translocase subunit SecB
VFIGNTTDIHTLKEKNMSFETPKLPEVKFNKNGYEIRTDILDMAKGLVSEEFHVKFQGWEMTAERDQKTNQIVSKVNMPEYPGLDKVLETAEKMYAFVNQGTSTKK